MGNWLCGLLFFFLLASKLVGQDMQFSQFYASPLYINPGFTGSTVEHRFIMNYRHQWPNVPGAFQSYHASYDYNAEAINSGFGLIMNREESGSFGLTTNLVALSYAYRIQLNRKTFLQPGMKFAYAFRSVDFNKLVFNDQLEQDASLTADENAFLNEVISYPDISSGVLLYSENYWAGASVNHWNEPNQSLESGSTVSELPMKISVHGGFKFNLSGSVIKRLDAQDITTAIHYKSQGSYDQIDLGLYYNHAPFVFGAWYRGIQGFKSYDAGYNNNDAIIALVGFKIPERNFSIGYSYDITISRLVSNSGGAHEISIIYETASKKSRRRNARFLVPCAKF